MALLVEDRMTNICKEQHPTIASRNVGTSLCYQIHADSERTQRI